ncbi:nucleotide pyrophosphorylase [Seminavis robusta]|uniref:Nicotinate-nucleotide pyrophosphorylase [carboxylating] n=1 Tax=Seminavis robusta TaxID=568900 RepID=A0A9N8GZG7_9STRA|nr:nucleotide pyrophosphorylase [Seminavis robusta]|eukprot:Sro3_g002890.1 nucleotide pyrophosphorylase (309) ;mRNA; r:271237-272268
MASSSQQEEDGAVTTDFSALLPQGQIRKVVQQWLDDDMPSMMDVGGLVVGTAEREAKLWMKSPGVVAGKVFFDTTFDLLGCKVTWQKDHQEGVLLDTASGSQKVHLATVVGPVNRILQGERTALNAMSRCSGVATLSRQAVQRARELNWKGYVAGTRKTTPGFRIVEKYGLLVGGAATHRLDLSQMVMLKDNHIWSAGSITKAVTLARKAAGFSQKIEVECQSLDEALEAAKAGADIVMLDNFQPEQLKKDAATIKQQFPHLIIEASGGITTDTMPDYLCDSVDVVSQGKLTQGYSCVDYSLKIVPPS